MNFEKIKYPDFELPPDFEEAIKIDIKTGKLNHPDAASIKKFFHGDRKLIDRERKAIEEKMEASIPQSGKKSKNKK